MAFKGNEKHIFLGGNTPKGFFSYYNHLLPYAKARKIYCIKGGPGTGKSTLMKTVAEAVRSRGADVEYAHCSSDPSSLDAIVIRPASIALVDGTEPHIVDPRYPGAADTIINLGECWDENALRPYKDAIMNTKEKISTEFARAYRYLASARCLCDEAEEIYKKCLLTNRHRIYAEKILYSEFAETPVAEIRGKSRKLFATAITPEGVINYCDTILAGYKVYVVKGYAGDTISQIREIALDRGFDTEEYYCPMYPDTRVEHLLVPALNIAFTTSDRHHGRRGEETEDFDEALSRYLLSQYSEEREFAESESDKLIGKAISAIRKAKELHDILEKYYIPAMDFDKLGTIGEKTVKEILEFI